MRKRFYLPLLLIMFALFMSCKTNKQTTNNPSNVVYVVDGVVSNQKQMEKVDKTEVLEINVLKGKSAKDLYGARAKAGVVLVSTKKGAVKAYQKKFSSISPEYAKLIKTIANEKDIVYIIDHQLVVENQEITLFNLKAKKIKEIKVIDPSTTKMDYKLETKEGAVLIFMK